MSKAEEKEYDRFVWVVVLLAILCNPIAIFIGDMLLVCCVYGADAYFRDELRIVKHKPYTLSSGAPLPDMFGFIGWFLDAVIWIGLIVLSACILDALRKFIKNRKWKRNVKTPNEESHKP